jgi:GNAT superfamily N-acetyltransferase
LTARPIRDVIRKESRLTETGLLIRKATPDDADAIFVLVAEFATSFRPEKEAFLVSLKSLLPDESALLVVAELDGDVVGYCLGFDHYAFYANGRVSWVEEIMVRTDLRKKGIGRALMETLEVWAEERGSKLVGLATRRAASFYKGLGYEDSAVFFRKLLGELKAG